MAHEQMPSMNRAPHFPTQDTCVVVVVGVEEAIVERNVEFCSPLFVVVSGATIVVVSSPLCSVPVVDIAIIILAVVVEAIVVAVEEVIVAMAEVEVEVGKVSVNSPLFSVVEIVEAVAVMAMVVVKVVAITEVEVVMLVVVVEEEVVVIVRE